MPTTAFDIAGQIGGLFDAARERGAEGPRVVAWRDDAGEFAGELDGLVLPDDVDVVHDNVAGSSAFALKCRVNALGPDDAVLLYREGSGAGEPGDWLLDVEQFAMPFRADRTSMLLRELGAVDTAEMRAAVGRYRGYLGSAARLARVRALGGSLEDSHELDLAVMASCLGLGVRGGRGASGGRATGAGHGVAGGRGAVEASGSGAGTVRRTSSGSAVLGAGLAEGESVSPAVVVTAFLVSSAEDGGAAARAALEKAGAYERFCALLRGPLGYAGEVGYGELAAYVLLSAASAGVSAACLAGFEGSYRADCSAFCLEIVSAWRGCMTPAEFAAAVAPVEEHLGLAARLSSILWRGLLGSDVLFCAEEAIVRGALREAAGAGEGLAALDVLVAARSASYWYATFEDCYECLRGYVRMELFRRSHAEGFSARTAAELWGCYTSELCAMDADYRHVTQCVIASIRKPPGDVDEAVRLVGEAAERLYRGWFLDTLGSSWSALAASDYAELGYVRGLERSLGFFVNEAVPVVEGPGLGVVIISDGLRFEVARELAVRLERETQGKVDLRSQQAPFPSITSCGMAALLPSTGYRVDGTCGVRAGGTGVGGTGVGGTGASGAGGAAGADGAGGAAGGVRGGCGGTGEGLPTDTIAHRQDVLRTCVPGAVAVSYPSLVGMTRAERRKLMEGARLAYVYHNAIDVAGENDEDSVFGACDVALDELVGLVQILVRELRVTNVVITADHGFVFTREPLGSLDKLGADEVSGEVTCVTHRRAMLARPGATSASLLRVNMAGNGADDLVGFTPRGYIRLRQRGSGDRYVHGGTSLQEVCVPVLRFRNLRRGSKAFVASEPAPVRLLSAVRTVTSLRVRVDFQQMRPVGGKVLPATYEACFVDERGAAVSGVALVRADRTQVDGTEGTIGVMIDIRPGQYSERDAFYLVVREVGSAEETLREHFSFRFALTGPDVTNW